MKFTEERAQIAHVTAIHQAEIEKLQRDINHCQNWHQLRKHLRRLQEAFTQAVTAHDEEHSRIAHLKDIPQED